MNIDTFISQLAQHGFTPSETDALTALVTPLELPTRHILVNQGEHPAQVYFVVDGLCHASYLTGDGKQFSKEFYWEQDWVIGFESLITGAPSPFLLETLTPVQLLCLPVEHLQQWRRDNNPLYLRLLETQLLYKEQKERFMLLYTPQERYAMFCDSYPDLEQRLNDYQIAAYLGISPISLSRIKGRVNKG